MHKKKKGIMDREIIAALTFLMFVFFTNSPIHADVPELISRKVLLSSPSKTSPKISLDGKMIAYLAPKDGALNVWVKTVGRDDDRLATSDSNRGIRKYSWAGDSKHILYLQDKGGNEQWHLYITPIDSKSSVKENLTPFEGVRVDALFGIRVSRMCPDFVVVAMNKDDPQSNDLYLINIKTKEITLLLKSPGKVINWVIGKGLKPLGCKVKEKGGGERLLAYSQDKKEWKTVKKYSSKEHLSVYSTDASGKIWYIAHTIGSNFYSPYALNIENTEEKLLFEPQNADVEEILFLSTGDRPKAFSVNYLRRKWIVLDEALREDFEYLSQMRRGDFKIEDASAKDELWLVSYNLDNGPIYYYLYDRKQRKARFLFSHKPQLEKLELAAMKPVVIRARDGLKLPSYLTLPAESDGKNLPMVLYPHGGPWGRNRWGFDNEVQLMANRGYAVLQVNFRGSYGFGNDFLNAGNREWGRKMHYDLVDAVKWAVQKGIADPEKIAILGTSYGGYAALVGAAFTPDLFCCAVDICGISNILTWVKAVPPYMIPIIEELKIRVGDWEEDPHVFDDVSPIFKADGIKIPLLIGQGKNDPRVRVSESLQIVEAMRENSKPVIYVEFPDEGHGFRNPKNKMAFWALVEKFLAEHLGGRLEPPSKEEEALLKKVVEVYQ
jgi:dipeptidyl aminopeptidase/acylaminoacyl peptidase